MLRVIAVASRLITLATISLLVTVTADDMAGAGRFNAPAPLPKAWVLVDVNTGNVISAVNDHVPLPPASLSKLLTAIIAVEDLPADAQIPVSATAQGMEAASINMKVGEVWPFDAVLHSVLIVSANDAAVALAERVSGSREMFVSEMDRWANILGLVDRPALEDPAGLDDAFAFNGGNRISAYDLAIIGRAALAIPQISAIVRLPTYSFLGPDGVVHTLPNNNRLLEAYPGALGVKTGYTALAGSTFIGAVTRNGRTMMAVEMGTPDVYASATALLNLGFATPVSAESVAGRLPPVRLAVAAPPTSPLGPRGAPPPTASRLALADSAGKAGPGWVIAVVIVALTPLATILIAIRARQRARQRSRQRRAAVISPPAVGASRRS